MEAARNQGKMVLGKFTFKADGLISPAVQARQKDDGKNTHPVSGSPF
jgi:hypothetical protein